MPKIEKIDARAISDSRGDETIEAELFWEGEIMSKASVPQGKSKGEKEVISVPASQAIKNIQEIIFPQISGRDFSSQKDFDNFLIELDGTNNKGKLGGNTLLVLSLAFARGLAQFSSQPLYSYIAQLAGQSFPPPKPPSLYLNLIEGGSHVRNSSLEFQEYLVVVSDAETSRALAIGKEIFQKLGVYLEASFGAALSRGDEGGYSAPFKNYEQPLSFLNDAIKLAGYQAQAKLALDVAANYFASQGENIFYKVEERNLEAESLLEIYHALIRKYPFISLEDPFAENDIQHYTTLNRAFSGMPFVVGDDLTVTNPSLIKKAAQDGAVGGVIIKPNQIGTLTETLDAVRIAKENNLKIIVSHRSGETEDSFIADLAYGVGAFGLKAGAPGPKERMVKYQRLIEIQKEQEEKNF